MHGQPLPMTENKQTVVNNNDAIHSAQTVGHVRGSEQSSAEMLRFLARQQQRQAKVLYIPLAIMILSFVLMTVFQITSLKQERNNLNDIKQNQQAAYVQATKMRAQMDSIASKTAELAKRGNNNAMTLVSELKAKGITIHSNSSSQK
jgi:hypothetical protein